MAVSGRPGARGRRPPFPWDDSFLAPLARLSLAMLGILGSPRRDRVQLISTLRSLGSTSLPGLAAALSWSESRTVRTIHAVTRHGEAAIEFDAHRRVVRFALLPQAHPRPSPAPPSSPVTVTPPPLPTPVHGVPSPPTTPRAPEPPLATSLPRCPSCHARLTAAGMPGIFVCSQCGELHHQERETAATPAPTAPLGVAPASRPSRLVAAAAPSTGDGSVEDRRGQELFAAWVTAQPIPCPKCRTSLRHRGVGEYGCPSCGTHLRFDLTGTVSRIPGPSAAASAPSL